jgi:hypothetical protein
MKGLVSFVWTGEFTLLFVLNRRIIQINRFPSAQQKTSRVAQRPHFIPPK